jgi:hypothetical protein
MDPLKFTFMEFHSFDGKFSILYMSKDIYLGGRSDIGPKKYWKVGRVI